MQSRKSQFSQACRTHRSGFTLIEVLMVIAIIGILVGLAVPAVMFGMRSVKQRAIVIETQTLANAIDQYKNKYGDFPADGSNRVLFEKHFRKAFSNISNSEFTVLYAFCNASNGLTASLTVMDPSEALVFALGGFSSDPVYPFTGVGGPLFLMNNSNGQQINSSVAVGLGSGNYTAQYNVDRTNAFFEFTQDRLSLVVAGGITLSNDEGTLFGAPNSNDLMPVYTTGGGRLAPYVYYDSRTYSFGVSGATFYNFYNPTAIGGVCRPYKSDEVNTTVSATVAPDAHFRYMNDKSFQILSAGLDDAYGGVAGTPFNGTPQFYRYPSGQSLDITTGQSGAFARYAESNGAISTQLDNTANFADGIFEDPLE